MEDRIDELKKLIVTLEEDSPLRKQLEEALAAEIERKAAAESEASANQSTANAPKEEPPKTEESTDESEQPQTNDSNDEESTKNGKKSSNPFDGLDTIVEKLDELMENEEFITASAGFVLGAAAVGLCVLGLNVLKK